ncbi:unnamed protein product [Protopolystoma xenopodis]|uniref:Uncharacterized protein n=1 Tax=Protopolystoma xenopodis TaxID=117903 RepID=A0A3S5FF95_9PLAT|nr:unnamed protein product [Protopolystoma xenopodis]
MGMGTLVGEPGNSTFGGKVIVEKVDLRDQARGFDAIFGTFWKVMKMVLWHVVEGGERRLAIITFRRNCHSIWS